MGFTKDTFIYNTPSRHLLIEKLITDSSTSLIRKDKTYFSNVCKDGCINYAKKYSCPPYSPSFDQVSKNSNRVMVICYKIFLSQYSDQTVYNGIRAANSVLKSILDKELLALKASGAKVLGSGSCRACKECGAKTKSECKKPDRQIYSLESVGVDVNHLVETLFGFSLQWYKKDSPAPEYTCVVGGVLC